MEATKGRRGFLVALAGLGAWRGRPDRDTHGHGPDAFQREVAHRIRAGTSEILKALSARGLVAIILLAVLTAWPAGAQTTNTLNVTLTVAQMTACNTAPIEILAAAPGVAYLPSRVLGVRTGARYETQPGEIQIRYGTAPPANPVHMRLDTAAGGLLTQRAAWLAFGLTTGRYGADDALATDVGGKAMDLFCSVGNPTVSLANPGSEVELTVVYDSWTTTPSP